MQHAQELSVILNKARKKHIFYVMYYTIPLEWIFIAGLWHKWELQDIGVQSFPSLNDQLFYDMQQSYCELTNVSNDTEWLKKINPN